MPYTYINVDTLKGTGALNLNGTAFDVRLRQLGEAVSTSINGYTNRRFQPFVGTKFYSGNGGAALRVGDFVSIPSAGIMEDDTSDGTFNVTWGTLDYIFAPYNADPTGSGKPYTSIEVSPYSNGTQDAFLAGVRNYRIIGTWGYNIATSLSGHIASANIDTTQTTFNTTASVGSVIAIGDTIRINSEMMYVQNKDAAGTLITVARAQNGSTAGSHGQTTATITVYAYPSPITEAAFIQVARLWTRKDSAFANSIGFGENVTNVRPGLDKDVKELLNTYRKIPMGGA